MANYKTLILSCFFLLNSFRGFSQQITIKYTVEKDKQFSSKNSVSKYLLGIAPDTWDHVDLNNEKNIPSEVSIISNTPSSEVLAIKYSLGHPGTYFLKDMFGHELLLNPFDQKDTLDLKLSLPYRPPYNEEGRKKSRYLNDSIRNTKYYIITYPDKYKYVGFFDSLAYLHGDLRTGGDGKSFKELNHDLNAYLPHIQRVYEDRLKFYRNFVTRYHMPAKLRYYTKKEIQFAFYNDLLTPLSDWNSGLFEKYPSGLRDTIISINKQINDSELFERVSTFKAVLKNYLLLGISAHTSKLSREEPNQMWADKRRQFCRQNLKGAVQQYGLAWLMQLAAQQNSKALFLNIYKDYDRKKSSQGTQRMVDSLANMILKQGNISEQEVLDLTFTNSKFEDRKLSTLLTKKLIVIDCWATWCIPCRQQQPALDSLALEYKDQVQFISVSADQNFPKWQQWLTKQDLDKNPILQLYAPGNFQNMLFKRLLITAIPRYILISGTGKILNTAMPFPSQRNEFKSELKKYLSD